MIRSDSVTSADGTLIGFRVIGEGPGLVVVHGNASSSEDFVPVAELLADKFTLHLMDRRGRGLSGPQGSEYGLSKECEDVDAILKHTHCSFLFGHSYGALVALEYASNHAIERLALYDPPLLVKSCVEALLPGFEAAMNVKDYAGAYSELVRGLDVMPDLDKFKWYLDNVIKPSPEAWNRVIQLMEATKLEIREVQEYDPAVATSRHLSVRSLILLGELSPSFILDSVTLLRACISDLNIVLLPGQGHTALASAPDLIAEHLAIFLSK